jgi:hypothetical protein
MLNGDLNIIGPLEYPFDDGDWVLLGSEYSTAIFIASR